MNFAAWLPLFAVFALFSTVMLVHLARTDVPYMPKWAWALLIVITMPLGGVLYLVVVVMGGGVERQDAEGRLDRS